MSASSHDAIPSRHGRPLRFDAPGLDAADPTEDIAEEPTSELGVAAPRDASPAPEGAATQADGTAEPAPPPSVGSLLRDRYLLERQVGAGGYALVFEALDRRRDGVTEDGLRVAVKLLRPERSGDPHSIARLQREFRQTQAAAHPGVVRFFDLDCDRGHWFIVMELLAGQTLAAALRRSAPGGLPRPRALELVAGVADALAHAHARGIVHGDIKPGNVFVTDGGDVRVFDFGAARAADDAAEPVAATRSYASPEVLAGAAAEARDDVFSLACVACQALSGEHPFGPGAGGAPARTETEPVRPGGLDDATWQVLRPALDRGRSARPDMQGFARALRDAASPRKPPPPLPVAVAAPPAAAPARAAVTAAVQAARARRPGRAAGAAAIAGLALVLGILIGRLDPAADPSAPAVAAAPRDLPAADSLPSSPGVAAGADAAVRHAPVRDEAGPAAVASDVPAPAVVGQMSFDLPAMSVSNRAVVAAIPLRHVTLNNAAREARVNWRIIEGSARSGQDFGGPQSGVESFAAGNTFRILYVPIVANPEATRDRTFVVELTGASPGVRLGATPRIAVTILGDG